MRLPGSRRPLVALTVAVTVLGGLTAAIAAPGASHHGSRSGIHFPGLAAVMTTDAPAHGIRPGRAVRVDGVVHRTSTETGRLQQPVAAKLTLRLHDADHTLDREVASVTTDDAGRFSAVVPRSATRGVTPTARTKWREVLALEATDVKELKGNRSEASAGAAPLVVAQAATGLQVENSFVSSVGWVKPGDTYPFRVLLRNFGGAKNNVKVTINNVPGMVFDAAHVLGGGAGVSQTASSIKWNVGGMAAGSATSPTLETLIVDDRARSLTEDPKVVWRNLSTTADLSYTGGNGASTSHGPRVIPPDELFDSARYGDRPFPVVPVDYLDFKHDADHPASALDRVINGKSNKGSTFNLYQEMSLGQLFPNADIPSAGVAAANYDAADNQRFTTIEPASLNTCQGITAAQVNGAPIAGQPRIDDGWYQLPGQRGYYGADANGSAVIGAQLGVGQLQAIDDGCGPAAKLAYDAAVAADPDLDFSDFDTDKDGVVDFFEVIFQGLGGNGESQALVCPPTCPVPPYDNVWPHSSTLESTYVDTSTGLGGYISKDQLKDLEGRPLWYTDTSRARMTTTNKGNALKVFVRVGPYNVNPETAIDHASVISHEYGHSLGAPDYYSTGSRDTYGDFMLMATDKSQNVSAFQLQEWGWVVPQPVPQGKKTVEDWTDTKKDTHKIRWQTPDGDAYTLSGPSVHNARVYAAKLPRRQVLDPKKVKDGASPTHVWWSKAGNDFGCAPLGGHNLDIPLPQLKKLAPGTPVTLSYKTAWEIEWDFDYGFVLLGTPDDKGVMTYDSVPSESGYTTPSSTNPNSNPCLEKFSNGLTGSSTSYVNGTQEVDRRGIGDVTGLSQFDSYPDFKFVQDSFDISALAGKDGVLRFSYSSDPGLAKAGWFIDDVKITAGGKTIYSSDFESSGDPTDPNIFNGGCQGELTVASKCTNGWLYLNTSKAAPFDHGYYLSLRDRSGFDQDGHGQIDRSPIEFTAGLLLEHTDEAHGYGNVGVSNPPAQSPLDARPTPGDDTPNLNDATFLKGDAFSDRGKGHVDNYADPSTKSGDWEFKNNCLEFKVTKMSGGGLGPKFPAVGAGSDLTEDVRFNNGAGCAAFDYGFGVPNTAPFAVAEAKPRKVNVGEPVTFNGSQSHDDNTAPSALRYRWDFNGDGETDATGATVQHKYSEPGTYKVRLVVVDSDDARGSSTVTVTVAGGSTNNRPGPGGGGGDGIPTTGLAGWVAPLALLLLSAGVIGFRMRRRSESLDD